MWVLSMKKYSTLFIKDLIRCIKNPLSIIIVVFIPLLICGIISFLSFNSMKSVTIFVDKRLKMDFKQDFIEYDINGQKRIVRLSFLDLSQINAVLQSEKEPFVYLISNNIKTFYVDGSVQNSESIIRILGTYYSGEGFPFKIEFRKSEWESLISMLLILLVIMSSITLSSSFLSTEIEQQNLLLLRKAEIPLISVLISQALSILLIIGVIFLFLYLIVNNTVIKLPIRLVWLVPIASFFGSLAGFFVSSITIKKEIQQVLLLLVTIPTIVYQQLEKTMGGMVRFLIELLPSIQGVKILLYGIKIENSFNILISIISLVLFFVITLSFLKRNIIKNA